MTSDARRVANRANAQKSTGPRSREGKARSSQNATRHGLTRSSADDPAAQGRLAGQAASLAGEAASPALLAQAQLVAAAQIDVAWARAARIRLQGRWSEALLASPAAGDHDETAAAPIDPHLFEALALAGTLDHAALAVPGPAVRGARKTLARIDRLLASSRKTMREHERSERKARSRRAHKPQPRPRPPRPLRAPRPAAPPHGRATLGRVERRRSLRTSEPSRRRRGPAGC